MSAAELDLQDAGWDPNDDDELCRLRRLFDEEIDLLHQNGSTPARNGVLPEKKPWLFTGRTSSTSPTPVPPRT